MSASMTRLARIAVRGGQPATAEVEATSGLPLDGGRTLDRRPSAGCRR